MMGRKDRAFASRVEVSLEDLVPAGHFYRQLERTLDLAFVRDLNPRLLRQRRATGHRSGGLLQAATRPSTNVDTGGEFG
jgi:hypothetical protein